MHEDDEKRFPRITLWQFLSGLFWWWRDTDKFLDGRWVSDLASMEAPDKKRSAPDAEEELSSRGRAAEPGIHKR
jgi:hypothetical protein